MNNTATVSGCSCCYPGPDGCCQAASARWTPDWKSWRWPRPFSSCGLPRCWNASSSENWWTWTTCGNCGPGCSAMKGSLGGCRRGICCWQTCRRCTRWRLSTSKTSLSPSKMWHEPHVDWNSSLFPSFHFPIRITVARMAQLFPQRLASPIPSGFAK